MKTEEFKSKIKRTKYVKIITEECTLYEISNTIKVDNCTTSMYKSTGAYIAVDRNGNYNIHGPHPSGFTFINEIKSVAPITEKEWNKMRLLCII